MRNRLNASYVGRAGSNYGTGTTGLKRRYSYSYATRSAAPVSAARMSGS